MFDEKFKEAVRNREYYRLNDYELPPESVFGWKEAVWLLDSHPDEERIINESKLGFLLTAVERRNSAPKFIKDIIKELESIFPNNQITAHIYSGFTKKSKSLGSLHRDPMDVLYLQVLGNVEWSMWQANKIQYYEDSTKTILDKEEADLLYSSLFKPGNMIWVPREEYHLVKPINSRLGVSFGIEGKIDPATYI
jgi:ribosomal protein L16 Arg81 hydroxylase